jgi:hypothetical protein
MDSETATASASPAEPAGRCFVIGPIGDENSPERLHADWLFMGIVKHCFDQNFPGWQVERADMIPTPGMISSQIINRLHDVELVIADLTFHNANAFYEMAILHKVGKPIIHMIRKGDKIPFDVIPHRAIPFSIIRPQDHEEARSALKAAIAEATKPGFEPDNPISHARGRLEFEEHAIPAMKIPANEILSIKDRLDSVETSAMSAWQTANLALGSPPTLSEGLGVLVTRAGGPNSSAGPRQRSLRERRSCGAEFARQCAAFRNRA